MLQWAIEWAYARGLVVPGDLAVVSRCPRRVSEDLDFKDIGNTFLPKLLSLISSIIIAPLPLLLLRLILLVCYSIANTAKRDIIASINS